MRQTSSNNRTQELGRTMVQNILMLAIITITTSIIIFTYDYLRIRYKAKDVMQRAQMAYVELKTQNPTNDWIQLKTKLSNGLSYRGHVINDNIFVLANNIDNETCERLLTYNEDVLFLDTLGRPLTTCHKEGTDMVFDFGKKNGLFFPCDDDTDCKEIQYCSQYKKICIIQTPCTYPTPVWSFKSDKCDVCPADTPVWNSEISECEACEFDTPYYNGEKCDVCPADKPFWDNTKCVSCVKAMPGAPVWSDELGGCVACAEKNTQTPIWNADTALCEPCPESTPYWDIISGQCVPLTCEKMMHKAGFKDNDFTINNNAILVNKDMHIKKNLPLTGCQLYVNGTLTIDLGADLTVKSLYVNAKNNPYGIYNKGDIWAATTIEAKLNDKSRPQSPTTLTETSNLSYSYTIYNTGTITAQKITATGGTTPLSYAIYGGQLTANEIIAQSATYGIENATITTDSLTYCPTTTAKITPQTQRKATTKNSCPE